MTSPLSRFRRADHPRGGSFWKPRKLRIGIDIDADAVRIIVLDPVNAHTLLHQTIAMPDLRSRAGGDQVASICRTLRQRLPAIARGQANATWVSLPPAWFHCETRVDPGDPTHRLNQMMDQSPLGGPATIADWPITAPRSADDDEPAFPPVARGSLATSGPAAVAIASTLQAMGLNVVGLTPAAWAVAITSPNALGVTPGAIAMLHPEGGHLVLWQDGLPRGRPIMCRSLPPLTNDAGNDPVAGTNPNHIGTDHTDADFQIWIRRVGHEINQTFDFLSRLQRCRAQDTITPERPLILAGPLATLSRLEPQLASMTQLPVAVWDSPIRSRTFVTSPSDPPVMGEPVRGETAVREPEWAASVSLALMSSRPRRDRAAETDTVDPADVDTWTFNLLPETFRQHQVRRRARCAWIFVTAAAAACVLCVGQQTYRNTSAVVREQTRRELLIAPIREQAQRMGQLETQFADRLRWCRNVQARRPRDEAVQMLGAIGHSLTDQPCVQVDAFDIDLDRRQIMLSGRVESTIDLQRMTASWRATNWSPADATPTTEITATGDFRWSVPIGRLPSEESR